MKFNKLFFAAVAFATLAMVSCKKEEPTPVIPTPEEEEEAPECPSIAAPASGQTTIAIYAEVCPRGAYLVGNFQGNNIHDDAAEFKAVPNAENWYAVTIDHADDLAVKAIARPSDEDVAYNWSYQWGLVYDANHSDPAVAENVEDTKVLAGAGTLVFENNCEVKLTEVANGGVVYVWVKNWKTSPIIEAKKLETCWAKSNLNGADWAWYEMTPKGDGVFELEATWGGSGCDIAETENGSSIWYGEPELIDEPAAGDKVLITFVSEKMTIGKLSIKLLEKGQHEVVPAGNGTFYVTVANREYTEGDVCIFTGNFDEKSWGDSDRAMTYDAGTGKWSWTGDYPEDFEYKVIYNGSWAGGSNVKFDGSNYEATFEIQ